MFLVGPAGLYREAVYVAMSRARHGSLPVRHRPPGRRTRRTTPHRRHPAPRRTRRRTRLRRPPSRRPVPRQDARQPPTTRSCRPSPTSPTNTTSTGCGTATSTSATVTAQLVAAGYTDPTNAALRLARARAHRQFLTPGTRVNAADWDNVGTVIAVFDNTGTALVEFTSTDRQTTRPQAPRMGRHPTRRPPRTRRPHPRSDAYFDLAQAAVDEHARRLDRRPRTPTASTPTSRTSSPRRSPCAANDSPSPSPATHPRWLTYWYGPRPTDPAGAQVWDDEIAQLAAWRDARHLDPDHPRLRTPTRRPDTSPAWAEHQDRSLATRDWLHDHTANLPRTPPATRRHRRRPGTARRARPAPRRRTRRPDPHHRRPPQRRTPPRRHPPGTRRRRRRPDRNDASGSSSTGPTSSNTPNSPSISDAHDPLAHWPTPIPPEVQRLARPARRHHRTTPPTPNRSPTSTSDSPTPAPKPSRPPPTANATLRQRLAVVDTALTPSRRRATRAPQPAPRAPHHPHRRRRTPDPQPRITRRHVELGPPTRRTRRGDRTTHRPPHPPSGRYARAVGHRRRRSNGTPPSRRRLGRPPPAHRGHRRLPRARRPPRRRSARTAPRRSCHLRQHADLGRRLHTAAPVASMPPPDLSVDR